MHRFAAPLAFALLVSLALPGAGAAPGALGAAAPAWGDLDEASGGAVAVVTVSCFNFGPDVVDTLTGDTVRFEHADACGANPHTVTNSGSAQNAQDDLNRPPPFGLLVGDCFDSVEDFVGYLLPDNPVYELSLTFSTGLLQRDAGTPDARVCLDAHSLLADAGGPTVSAVVPYHCRVHGSFTPPGEGMRGAIVVHA